MQRPSLIKTGLLMSSRKDPFPSTCFVPSNVISILTSSKLDNDFLRPITFQPVIILNVWWLNCHAKLIENFEGSSLQIIVTNTVQNTDDLPVMPRHSRLEYWLFPQHCLSNATTRSCNLLLHFLFTYNSDSIFLKLFRISLRS